MAKVLRAARSRRAVSAVESLAARPITTASSGPPQTETEHCQAQRKILDFLSSCVPAGPPLTKHRH